MLCATRASQQADHSHIEKVAKSCVDAVGVKNISGIRHQPQSHGELAIGACLKKHLSFKIKKTYIKSRSCSFHHWPAASIEGDQPVT